MNIAHLTNMLSIWFDPGRDTQAHSFYFTTLFLWLMTSSFVPEGGWVLLFHLTFQWFLYCLSLDKQRKLGMIVVLPDGLLRYYKKRKRKRLTIRKKGTKYKLLFQLYLSCTWIYTIVSSSIQHILPQRAFMSSVSFPIPSHPYQRALIAAYNFNQDFTDSYDHAPPITIQVDNISSFQPVYGTVATTTNLPIVFDTGASTSVTPLREDFLGSLELPQVHSLHGLKGAIEVKGTGIVSWPIIDMYGVTRTIKTRAHYVPGANIRLFSPQVYFQDNAGGSSTITRDRIQFTIADGTTLQFPYNTTANIPLMLTNPQTTIGLTIEDIDMLSSSTQVHSYLSVADELNRNLTASQKELLRWHWRLGHANLRWIQALCASHRGNDRPDYPIIKTINPKVSSCELPLCLACQVGKQTRRGAQSATIINNPATEMALRRDDLQPGDMVSVDQYISTVLGRLGHTKGKEVKKDQYTGGTIFVDHATGYTYIKHQVTLRAGDTVRLVLNRSPPPTALLSRGITLIMYLLVPENSVMT